MKIYPEILIKLCIKMYELIGQNHFGDQREIRRALAEHIIRLTRRYESHNKHASGPRNRTAAEIRDTLIVLNDPEITLRNIQ